MPPLVKYIAKQKNRIFFEPRTVGQSPPATSNYIKKSRETSTYNRPNQRLGEQKKAKSEKGQLN
jgi:hypothetical protein